MDLLERDEFVVVPAAGGGLAAVAGALGCKLAEVARRDKGYCFIVSTPLGTDLDEGYLQGLTGNELVYLEAANLDAWRTCARRR